MSFLESLAVYTASQKIVAYGFIISGSVLLLAALLMTILSSDEPLWQGVRLGSVVFGLAMLAGGIGYVNFCGKVQEKVEIEYQQDTATTLVEEGKRMDKVVSDYPVYQKVFGLIVVISLIAIIFAKEFWSGFAFPVAFLFVAVLLIEAHSKKSIDAHSQLVNGLVTSANSEK